MSFKKYLVLLLTFSLLASVSLFAQSAITGDLAGTVADSTGAVIPNAAVTLKNTATGHSQTANTNSTGAYRFSLLQPGDYAVEASASGFQPVSQKISVALGSASTANFKLDLNSKTEVVEVTGDVASVETENANLNTNFNSKQVELLPNPGNDLTAAVLTTPGIQVNTSGGAVFGGGNYEIYGLPATANLFTYDGANDNDPYFNVNNSGATNLTLGLNDVQESAVVANGYSGQYGQLAGANINFVSKSGTNDWHGNMKYWWSGRALDANTYFANQTTPVTPRAFVNANQWAASLGGPIKKDKSFFFFDTEGLRLVIPVQSNVFVPTPSFEAATLSNLTANGMSASIPFYNQIFNIYNGAPGLANAQAQSCANFSPAFTSSGLIQPADGNCALKFVASPSNQTNDWLLVGRYDQYIGNNDKIFLRVQTEHGFQPSFTDPINSAFNAVSVQPEWQGQLSETHTFGSNKVNNLVLANTWYGAEFTFSNPTAEASTFAPSIFFSPGFTALNGGVNFPQGRRIEQYQIVDDFSWTHGKHTIKMGVNFHRDDVSDSTFFFSRGFIQEFDITGFAAGNSGFLLQNFPGNQDNPIALYNLGGYVEDDWKVTSNLSLTASLRLDHISNPVCQDDCFSRLTGPVATTNNLPTTPYNQVVLANQKNAFPSVSPIMVSPRIGLAWSPFGSKKTVVRAGGGLFTDSIPTGALDNIIDTNFPFNPQFLSFGTPISPAQPGNGFAANAAANAQLQSNFSSGAAPIAGLNPSFFNPTKVRVPRYLEYDLEVQRDLGWHTVVDAKYVGNHGWFETVQNSSANAFAPGGPQIGGLPAGFGGLPLVAPNPNFGAVTDLINVADSNYNGLVLSARHSVGAGLTVEAGYTYSHALDEVSNGAGNNTFANPLIAGLSFNSPIDPLNIKKFNYSNADYDVRNSFNMNYVWAAPFRNWVHWGPDALLKGWSFAGTIITRGGFPYSVVDSAVGGELRGANYGNTAIPANANTIGTGCGASAALINSTGGASNPCLLASNFSDPTTTWGNQRRNSFRGPGYFDTDFDVEKTIPIPGSERAHLQLGARFFNILNHPNFQFPVNDIHAGSAFGQIVSPGANPPSTAYGNGLGVDASGRTGQLEVKFEF